MKSIPLFIAASAAITLASCSAGPNRAKDHWSAHSVGPRMSRAFLGYQSDVDGEYLDYAWSNKQSINKTISRHLLNDNPDNPFTMSAETPSTQRPLNSPLPNPATYFHVESLVFGGLMYAAMGTFIPIPVDSIIATFSPGGGTEFFQGIGETVEPAGILLLTVLPGETYESDAMITGWSHPAGN